MLPSLLGALLTLTLLTDAAEAAEPPPVPTCSTSTRIDLDEPAELAAGVCVTPDEPTTFVFGTPLLPGAVIVSDNRPVSFAQGDNFVTVYPKRSFLPGEKVKLTVRFSDNVAPEEASFWLVGHAARWARRVELFRRSRPVDALKRAAAEAQAEARQCQEEKARLLSERREPGGLMGTAWLERTEDIKFKDISIDIKQSPGNALRARTARSYSHQGSVVVRLLLENPSAEPWTAAGAVLNDSMGTEVELSLWLEAAIPTGPEAGVVVVGLEKSAGQLGCPCTLKLWGTQGARIITLENVTFPAGEQAGKQGPAPE